MKKYIIGVDEAGRGPLAGPVTVAAVLVPRVFRLNRAAPSGGLKDSKKTTPRRRELWFEYIHNHSQIIYEVATISPGVIDKINIAKATNVAATRAVARLVGRSGIFFRNCNILLDGSLNLFIPDIKYRVIIRGDDKINAIKLASIVAKVKRDRAMRRLHKVHPHYNFAKHKGYGTREHKKAIKKYGACKIHRLTFIHFLGKN